MAQEWVRWQEKAIKTMLQKTGPGMHQPSKKLLTYEQRAVVEALHRRNQIKVYALAGTGKTTTLRSIGKKFQDFRMLYMAFNRAIAEKARGKFTPNVEVRTVHSLAWKYLGDLYGNRLSRIDYFEVAEALWLPVEYVFANIKYFKAFLNSSCPLERSKIISLIRRNCQTDPAQVADFILETFEALKTGKLQVDHAFYLKEFQLNFSSFGLEGTYDAVLLDEGQDVNPVILSIFDHFNAKKIMVGDRHQKIYGFNGAINALEDFEAEETFYLTNTFRFNGQEQVSAVNDLLYHLKCEDHLVEALGQAQNDDCQTTCVITRTNGKLLETLLENPDLKTVRHPKEYFWRIFDIYYRKIKVPDTGFKTFGGYLSALEEMGEEVGEHDLITCVNLVKRYRDKQIFQDLYDRALMNYGNGGRAYLGTAHSTKGLEFDEVRLTDDFMDPGEILKRLLATSPAICRRLGNGNGRQDSVFVRRSQLREVFEQLDDDKLREEINLVYVGLTRAKKTVVFPPKYLISDKYSVEVPALSMDRFGEASPGARQLF